MSVLNTIGFVINGESSLYDYNHLANKPVSDATLSQQGEFADAAATGAVKAKADSIYSETHFYPTSAGSHYVTFATVANESYRYKNNGSVTMGVSTRNGGSGGTRVETVGNIGPGEEVYFTASQNATHLSIYTGAAASDQELVISSGKSVAGQAYGKNAQKTIDARIKSIVTPVAVGTTWSANRIMTIPFTVYKGQTVNFLISNYKSTNNKKSSLAFGYAISTSTYYQQLNVTAQGLYKIKATADYDTIYIYITDSTVTTFKATVWVEGSIYFPRTFSILGDSYSTFQGYNPSGYATWYPETAISSNNDCQAVENTWWYKFAKDMKCALQLNESYSGTPICNDGWGSGTDDASTKSFIARMSKVPQSELIFIFGGTNDEWIGVEIGDYVYSGWTDAQKSQFRPAMAYMLDYMLHHHVGAKIVFIKNTGLTNLGESIDTICAHYGVPVIELTDAVTKVNSHPNINGMLEIEAQVIDALLAG